MGRVARPIRRHPDFWFGSGSGAIALGIAIVALRAWRLGLHNPIRLGGDATQVIGYVQNMLESGTPSLAPRLGAPFGQQYQDFPLGADDLTFTALRGIAAVTGDAIAAVNLYFLLTFPLVAVAAYWACRALGVGRPVAVLVGVTYAILPFHFLRGTSHLFLVAYFAVPLASFALMRIVTGRPIHAVRTGVAPSDTRWSRGRDRLRTYLPTFVIAALVASTGIYYVAFTLILLLPASVVGWARSGSRAVLVSAGLFGAVVVAIVLVELLPSFTFWLTNGTNPDVPGRGVGETGANQLRLVSLLIPMGGHRLSILSALATRNANAFPAPGETGEYMGAAAIVGLVVLAIVSVALLSGRLRRRRLWRQEGALAVLTLMALAVATSGGLSTLFALLVTPQIRAWARFTIFIDFFALLAFGLVLSRAWRLSHGRSRKFAALGLAGLLCVAALDETSNSFVPNYDALASSLAATRAFVGQVEASLPPGAGIYQLPYRPYPEGGVVAASADYDPLLPYLTSTDLRFSYGAVKGREAGWQLYLYRQQIDRAIPLLCAAGFSGVWLDRDAYGSGASRIVEDQLATSLGAAPVVGVNNRYVFYDARPACDAFRGSHDPARLASLQDEVVARPVWNVWQGGALPIAGADIAAGERRLLAPARLALRNEGAVDRAVTMSVRLVRLAPPTGEISISWPDGSSDVLPVSGALTKSLTLAAGDSFVDFTSLDGAPPVHDFTLADVWATDNGILATTGYQP